MLMLHCELSEPRNLWIAFMKDMSEDFLHEERLMRRKLTIELSSRHTNKALLHFQCLLEKNNSQLERLAGMPLPEAEEDHSNVPNIIAEELNYDRSALGEYLRINECHMNED